MDPQGQIFRVTDESDGSELVRYDYISHGDEQRLSDVQTLLLMVRCTIPIPNRAG